MQCRLRLNAASGWLVAVHSVSRAVQITAFVAKEETGSWNDPCSRLKLLALMGSANKVPICFAGYDAFDIAVGCPCPGLTGLAITSRRSYNLIEPIDRLELISASMSRLLRNLRCKVRSMTRLIGFAARHDSPHHAGHLVCHGYARHARWLPGEQREEARIRSLGLMPWPGGSERSRRSQGAFSGTGRPSW